MPQPPTDPPPRIAITGLGLITPLAHDAWSNLRALLDGRSLPDRLKNLDPDTDPFDVARKVGGVSIARHDAIDPAAKLAEHAARQAILEAGAEPLGLPTFLGCSKGAVVALERATTNFLRSGKRSVSEPDALAVALGPHQFLATELSRRLGTETWTHAVAACASSLVALHRARQALIHGQTQTALVVSAEAALTPRFVRSYQRLGVLAPLTAADHRGKPLDQHRAGFMLAEVGVAVVLQAIHPDQPWPKQGTRDAPELLDTACAAEAFDAIRPPTDMDALRFVAQKLMAGRPIAALHPHAPGTPGSQGHDPTELRTLADVLNAEREMTQAHAPVAVYASKGALGHTLGSAGLVSLVLACLIRRAGTRPPMPWLHNPMRGAAMPLQRDAQPIEPGAHAIFAAGFGGHTAGAIVA